MSRTGFELPPRLVDFTLLVGVVLVLTTGVGSFLTGTPGGAWVVTLHAMGALALVVPLGWKLRRVGGRLDGVAASPTVALSATLATAVVAALASGVAWVLGANLDLWGWTLLNLHVAFGLLVVPLLAVHLANRFRTPTTDDWEGRRTALQYAGLALVGAVGWRASDAVDAALGGVDRRFTGSKPAEGTGNRFPVTSWVLDDPEPVDRDDWRLHVTGLVEDSRTFEYDDVTAAGSEYGEQRSAVLDCTSGWYAERDWQGVDVASLLETVGVQEDARWVVFHSVTGYRFGFPVEAADDLLLATHVDGERLTHGHGFPLRVVAPGRRGFQWVKWVTAVECRRTRDWGQWVAIFVSGVG